jgi:drug/metabolite transporter (DMT)-like permease
VAAGFVGVLVALQPSAAAFGWYALIALAGSIVYSVFLVITRSVRDAPGVALASWQFIAALVVGAVTAPINWVPLNAATDAALLSLLGLLALVAIVCVNRSLHLAPASVVVPYQNTLIVWAILVGYVFFNYVPGWHLLAGAAIIVASCLYIFFREQKVAPRAEPDIISGP